MSAPARCARHPAASAGWYCHTCRAALCPGCTYVRLVTPIEIIGCTRCGEAVEVLTRHRSEARSFAARLPQALVATFTPAGLLTLAGTAIVLWLFGWFGIVGAVLGLGVYWGLLFAAIRQAGRGEPGLEPPDFGELWADVVRPGLLGLLAVGLLVLPAVLWLFYRPDGWGEGLITDPVLWAIGVASVLYAPIAILSAATGGSAGQMLNPVALVGLARQLGGDYLRAVGVCVLLVGVHVVVVLVAAASFGDVPFVSAVLRQLAGLLAPVLMARTLGLLLHVRGDAVGMGMPADYLEPALPGAVPRGSAPARAPAPEEARDGGRAGRFEAIELDPPSEPADDAARVAELVRGGDLPAAARLYATLRAPAAPLAADVLFQVAKGAAGAGDHLLAARALHAAAKTMDPAVAPDALLVLARICLQRLNRPADARSALALLLSRFPDSAAAKHGRALEAQVRGG